MIYFFEFKLLFKNYILLFYRLQSMYQDGNFSLFTKIFPIVRKNYKRAEKMVKFDSK